MIDSARKTAKRFGVFQRAVQPAIVARTIDLNIVEHQVIQAQTQRHTILDGRLNAATDHPPLAVDIDIALTCFRERGLLPFIADLAVKKGAALGYEAEATAGLQIVVERKLGL